MKKSRWWLVLALAVVVVLVLLFSSGRTTAGASTLSAGRMGWKGVALWLEHQDHEIIRVARPLHEALDEPTAVTLVTGFPAIGWYELEELDAVSELLSRGGTLVFGASSSSPGPAERQLAEHLGLWYESVETEAPLWPWSWYRWAQEEVDLEPVAPWPDDVVTMPRPSRRYRAPEEAHVLFRWSDGEPAIWEQRQEGGTVIVVPSAVFSNPFVSRAPNADLLQSLSVALSEPWAFDERRHGLVDPAADQKSGGNSVFDGWILHLLVLYAMTVLALARRFGPVWRDERANAGSTASFLLSMARLHRRLKHHRETARLLVERSCRMNTWIEPPTLDHPIENDADLLELERELGRLKERP